MEKDRFGAVLSVYVVLLVLIAGLAVFMVNVGTFPPPAMIQVAIQKDELFKEMLDDAHQKREQNGALTKLATHGFDVVLGALLGFLASNGIRSRVGIAGAATRNRDGGDDAAGKKSQADPMPDETARRD